MDNDRLAERGNHGNNGWIGILHTLESIRGFAFMKHSCALHSRIGSRISFTQHRQNAARMGRDDQLE